jgi:hypothetical protein
MLAKLGVKKDGKSSDKKKPAAKKNVKGANKSKGKDNRK